MRLESADAARVFEVLDERPSLSAFPALDATGFDVLTEFFAMGFTSFHTDREAEHRTSGSKGPERGPETV